MSRMTRFTSGLYSGEISFDFVGRKIEYIVDSGSTVARSGSQNEAKAMQLFQYLE